MGGGLEWGFAIVHWRLVENWDSFSDNSIAVACNKNPESSNRYEASRSQYGEKVKIKC